MYLHSQALCYSALQDLTLSQLKKGEFDVNISYQEEQEYCNKYQIGAVIQGEEGYPMHIAKTGPYVLYYQGNLDLLNYATLGIVGPRQPSQYGIQVIEAIFSSLAKYQAVTVSGFARGIDQKAHQLSLQYGIPTIAVLGGGFQYYLRGADRSFLTEIVGHGGLVISEFKLGFTPTKWSFPQRNKLIARIANMLFLPEAREKSGSLITAEFAYQMGKSVYSVPAPLFSPQSAGVFAKMNQNKLQLITDFDVPLKKLFPLGNAKTMTAKDEHYANFSELQNALLQLFRTKASLGLQEIVALSGEEYQTILQELTFLELAKVIEETAPGIYSKK